MITHIRDIEHVLTFNEELHKYMYSDVELKSVTTVIHAYFEMFDEDNVIKSVMQNSKSQYYMMAYSDIKAQWDLWRNLGTKMHYFIEVYLLQYYTTFNTNNVILPNIEISNTNNSSNNAS